ncbi:hypothetical protein HKX48_006203, partial [Thoreauomyces humboldtii]
MSQARLFGAGIAPGALADEEDSANTFNPPSASSTNTSAFNDTGHSPSSRPRPFSQQHHLAQHPQLTPPLFAIDDEGISSILEGGGSESELRVSALGLPVGRHMSPSVSSQFEAMRTPLPICHDWYYLHRHRVSDERLLKYFAVCLALVSASMVYVQTKTINYPISMAKANVDSCGSDWEFWPQEIFLSFFVFVIFPVVAWKFRVARENYGIRTELFVTIVSGIPAAILFATWGSAPESWNTIFTPSSWYVLAICISHTFSIAVPIALSYRYDRLRRKMVFLYNMESFAKVLTDKAVWDEFKVYMAADFCVENALFYEAYQELLVLSATAFARAGINCPGMPLHGSALAKSTIRGNNLFSMRRRASNTINNQNNVSQAGSSSPFSTSPSANRISSSLRTGANALSAGSFGSAGAPSQKPGSQKLPSINGGPSDDQPFLSAAFPDMPVPDSAKPHYRAFYDTYLVPNAPYEVNLPSLIRETVEQAFVSDAIRVGVFDAAKEEVVQSM